MTVATTEIYSIFEPIHGRHYALMIINYISGNYRYNVRRFRKIFVTKEDHLHTIASIDKLRAGVDERFDKVDQRFDKVDQRFDKVDQRFDRIDQRLDKMDERFDKMDERFDKMDARFDKMDERFDKMDERFDKMDEKINTLGDILEKRFRDIFLTKDDKIEIFQSAKDDKIEIIQSAKADHIALMKKMDSQFKWFAGFLIAILSMAFAAFRLFM